MGGGGGNGQQNNAANQCMKFIVVVNENLSEIFPYCPLRSPRPGFLTTLPVSDLLIIAWHCKVLRPNSGHMALQNRVSGDK